MNYYALVIEYFGQNYCGWQRQTHSPSVQEQVEIALSKISGENIEIVCAGRTDAGVHATAQVVNFSTTALREAKAWSLGVNSLLPKDIKVRSVHQVNQGFNARFRALYRRYNYLIYQNKTSSALWCQHSTRVKHKLDADAMNQACEYLIGEQDFSSFRSSQCQSNTSFRNIHHAFFKRCGDFIVFDIQGNAFLHHMVRNIVGSMLKVGYKEHKPQWIGELLLQKDRNQAGVTAASHGLYLVEVGYEDLYNIQSKYLLEDVFF